MTLTSKAYVDDDDKVINVTKETKDADENKIEITENAYEIIRIYSIYK